jgi:formate dehydrogenase gamma subunit
MTDIQTYLRFTKWHRIEHWTFMVSFTLLGFTGLMQKFASAPVSIWFVNVLGGVENVRLVHHAAAVAMMLVAIYHIGAIVYRLYVNRVRPTMLPTLKDLTDAWQALLYNLGLKKDYPQGDRYTFAEKVEYYAVVWGTIVMAITGFMMWNPIATTNVLPGEVIPAAKVAHGLEAILAVLAILIWHMYHVFIRHFNKSMYTGRIDEHEMLEDHPLELADIKAGTDRPRVDPDQRRKRLRIFWPVYGALAIVMLAGVYAFVGYEKTAVTVSPPAEDVRVFVPLTPTPLPTPIPTEPPSGEAPTSWDDGIADLFAGKCGICHNADAKLGGLDLSTYDSALQGGESGPAVVPGDPDASVLILVQSEGNHPGQLSGEELAFIRAWIEAGATEN